MLFNSIAFLVFLPIVFILYWFVTQRHLKAQNILLLVASYFFYSCWDWRFLFLLMFSTFLDFYSGIKIKDEKNETTKKVWFWLSISINLGFLCVFKYYNFFAASFAEGLAGIGLRINPWTLNVILPVGISFYTFHGLSYVIDVYKNRIDAERKFVDYAVFVSFFPLLVAGPIERATHLLPQIKRKRTFSYSMAVDGLRQILWGLFKKIVIADNCAAFANGIFDNYTDYNGGTLILGGVFFAFQIYGDFSGYSDIALGTAKLFGITLLRNFAYPYFSRDIAEFWRRWHISLSSWFRDYLYIPLGGSKGGTWMKVRNTFIIFLVSGFWHGANWTFIVWGLLNAIFIMPSIIFHTNRNNLEIVAKGSFLPSLKELISIVITFLLAVLAWIFFRAESLTHAFEYLSRILTLPGLPQGYAFLYGGLGVSKMAALILGLLVIEWIGREYEHPLARVSEMKHLPVRWAVYFFMVGCIHYFYGESQQFIYFEF